MDYYGFYDYYLYYNRFLYIWQEWFFDFWIGRMRVYTLERSCLFIQDFFLWFQNENILKTWKKRILYFYEQLRNDKIITFFRENRNGVWRLGTKFAVISRFWFVAGTDYWKNCQVSFRKDSKLVIFVRKSLNFRPRIAFLIEFWINFDQKWHFCTKSSIFACYDQIR